MEFAELDLGDNFVLSSSVTSGQATISANIFPVDVRRKSGTKSNLTKILPIKGQIG